MTDLLESGLQQLQGSLQESLIPPLQLQWRVGTPATHSGPQHGVTTILALFLGSGVWRGHGAVITFSVSVYSCARAARYPEHTARRLYGGPIPHLQRHNVIIAS